MRLNAVRALRDWAVATVKDAVELIPRTIDDKFSQPNPEHRWQRFSIRFKLLLFSLTEEAKTMPHQTHQFLSMITLGKLAIPPDFLIDFEKTQLAHVIGLDRKMKLPHELAEVKQNAELLEAEVELRKKHITMIIAVFVVSKVLVHDVFNSAYTTTSLFSDLPKTEAVYFHFYGLTLVALLTDLLYQRFQIQLAEANPGRSMVSTKHLLFDALLEPIESEGSRNQYSYSTFRYAKEREKRWHEMEDYFKRLISQVITDVSNASLGRPSKATLKTKTAKASQPAEESEYDEEEDEDGDGDEEEYDEEEEEEEEEARPQPKPSSRASA